MSNTLTSPTTGKELKVAIPYYPQEYQADIHEDNTRFKVVIIGRRGGKTELAINEDIIKAMQIPGLYWIIAPTFRQVKSIVWTRLKKLLANDPYWKFNEVELSAYHRIRDTRIELKGADKPETLKGVGLQGAILDECSIMKQMAWVEVVRPMLADTLGWALFITTPKGKNWVHDLYKKGLDETETEWASYHYPTSVNKYIAADEIAQAKKDMSERMFRQEFMAEFLDDETSVFKGVRRCAVGTLKEPVLGRFYIMGADLAKTQDFTVLMVMDSVTREVVAYKRFQNINWVEQKSRIQKLAHKYNNALVWLDSTGIGDPIFDDLQAAYVSVEGFKFTSDSKSKLVEQLAIAIEQRLITFPPIDEVILELMDFGYEYSEKTRRIRYSAPEGKHDDCVISLGLATWGMRSLLQTAQVVKETEEEPRDKVGQGELAFDESDSGQISGYR